MNGGNKRNGPAGPGVGMALCMAIGLAVGTAIGAASRQLGVWMPIGAAVGLGLGAARDRRRAGNDKDSGGPPEDRDPTDGKA